MELYHYPFHFVKKEGDYLQNDFLKYKLLYTFKSPKSHQWYWVWVEVYDKDFYAVKFHLKAHRLSKNKYNVMTGLFEARPVINTCIAIMQQIATENPHASFGFIGANMLDESSFYTKRFHIYSRMMATYFSDESFIHWVLYKKSAYVLMRRSELERNPDLINELNAKFKALYDFFD
ncbi:MAG: hypothetical protein IJ845_11435 [Bacteroidaceae bacterium]|nr:hypothetical protein [Bacteroidaceae bacterium]